VLEGTMVYRAGDEFHHLAAGSFIYLPPGGNDRLKRPHLGHL